GGSIRRRESIDNVDALATSAVGKRAEQGSKNHLLGGALVVAARLGPVDDATALVLRHPDRALTSTAGSLLLVRLAARTRNLAAAKRRVGTLTGGGALGDNHLVDERHVGLNIEELGGKINSADL